MYECSIVEVEDFGFNHYIHHIDEEEFYTYNEEISEIENDEILYENDPYLFKYFSKVGISD